MSPRRPTADAPAEVAQASLAIAALAAVSLAKAGNDPPQKAATASAAAPETSRGPETPAATSGGVCSKCEGPLNDDLGDQVSRIGNERSKQFAHKGCLNAYKNLAKRWTKKKILKTTWDSKPVEENKEWFAKNRLAHLKGELFDIDASLEVVSTKGSGVERRIRHIGLDFGMFSDKQAAQGWSEADIKTEWRRRVVDPKYKSEVVWFRRHLRVRRCHQGRGQ